MADRGHLPHRAGASVLELGADPSRRLETTLFLFEDDYALPLLPPVLAAYMAITIELVVPVLLLLGLATRFASLVVFGMTLVIEIFVYPAAWPTHIQWAAMMLVLMAYGAGPLSLDWLVRRWAGAPRGRQELTAAHRESSRFEPSIYCEPVFGIRAGSCLPVHRNAGPNVRS